MPKVEWDANHLQLGLFPLEPTGIDTSIWPSTVELDSDERKPRELTRRQTGQWNGGRLELVLTPIRTDLFWIPSAPTSPVDIRTLISIGPFEDRLNDFCKLCVAHVDAFPFPVKRITLIAKLVSFAKSVEDAYSTLGRSIKSLKISDKMRDVSFRVNWRADVSIGPIKYVNRLCTWSAGAAELGAMASAGAEMKFEKEFFAQLDLDINTPQDLNEPIEKGALTEALRVIFDKALENARNGECP